MLFCLGTLRSCCKKFSPPWWRIHFDVPKTQHVYDAHQSRSARLLLERPWPASSFAFRWDAFWLDMCRARRVLAARGRCHPFSTSSFSLAMERITPNIFRCCTLAGFRNIGSKPRIRSESSFLTRSAFLGQQRNGATVWSGDVYSTYWGLQHQVTAGLKLRPFRKTPYWTTDSGGYWQAI